MANLVGCLAMSHAPQLMLNPDHWGLLNNREKEELPDKPELERETTEVKWAKWNGCMEAIAKLRRQLEAFDPQTVIVIGDDQHENLVDDNMPPFSIYMGEEVEASVSLRYLKQPKSENRTKYQVDAKLAQALVAGLMDEGFDPAYSKRTRYDGGLGHACWNVSAAQLDADATVAGRIEEFMAGQQRVEQLWPITKIRGLEECEG